MPDASAAAPRSVLHLRTRPHVNPERQGEVIVDVVREGTVVGTIYGSREGIHIFSATERGATAIGIKTDHGAQGILIQLLRPGEPCPWCDGEKRIGAGVPCPLCALKKGAR